MKTFTMFFHEAGDVEVRSRKVINKYNLDVPFGNYDTEELDESIYLKGESIVEDGVVYEHWHCFKLLEHFNRGYYRHHKVEYSHSEKRTSISGYVIEKYIIN